MSVLLKKIAKWLWFFWVGLLLYFVIGGSIAILVEAMGFVGPYCMDPAENLDGTYVDCKPCGLHWSVFGLIDVSNCDNWLLETILTYTVAVPRFVIIALALFVYPLNELLSELSQTVSAITLVSLAILLGIRTMYSNFYKQKNFRRGVHRVLLVALLFLSIEMALSF